MQTVVKALMLVPVVLILSFLVVLTDTAKAQAAAETKPLKVGVVDRMKIIEDSKEGQTARATLEKEKNEKQRDLDKLQDELKLLQEDLAKQGALLTEEKKREKEETLVRKGRDLKRLYEDYNRDLSKRQDELLGSIMNKLNQAIKDYGQEQGYSLILDSTITLFQGSEVDITKEVLKRYNLKK